MHKTRSNAMKTLVTTLTVVLLVLAMPDSLRAQKQSREISIETEPVAYILGGAGITGSYRHGSWTYSLEAFGELTVPESLHGNTGFKATLMGLEIQVERFFGDTDGFFAGPEVGISRLEVTRTSSGSSKTHTGYSIGLRGGYHWTTGWGGLYLSPVTGGSFALNARDIRIAGKTFESGSVTPFATVGIGWSF